MRKKISYLIILVLLFGCGSNNTDQSGELNKISKNETTSETTGEENNDTSDDYNTIEENEVEEEKNVVETDNGVEIDISQYQEDENMINYVFGENEDGTVSIDDYTGNVRYLMLPNEYNGKKITRIVNAFVNSEIKGVIIPDGIRSIEDNSFNGCSSLETVIMSDTVIELGDSLYGEFEECTQLTNLRLSKNLKTIYDYAFKECSSLKTVVIPANVQYIGKDAFKYCESLENLIFEDGISTINASAFCGYLREPRLYNITIPKSVTSIEGDFENIHPNAIFHVVKGSYAEQFAIDKGYNVDYING